MRAKRPYLFSLRWLAGVLRGATRASVWLRLLPALLVYGLGVFAIWSVPTQSYPTGGPSLVEALYYGLQLFTLDGANFYPVGGSVLGRGLMWFALFAAPAITASAVLEGFLVVRRALRSSESRISAMAAPVVVCGYGVHGRIVVEEAVALHHDVVVVDQALADVEQLIVGSRVVPVVAGDMTVPETLQKAGAARATHLWFCSGDPLMNLKGALIARRAVPPSRPLTRALIPMVDDDGVEALLVRCMGGAGLQTFQQFGGAAEQLIALNAVRTSLASFRADATASRIVVVGLGRFGRAVLHRLLQDAEAEPFPGRTLLTLVDARAVPQLVGLRERAETLGWSVEERLGIDAEMWAMDVAAAPPHLVLMCTDSDSLNLRCAAILVPLHQTATHADPPRVQVVMRMFNPLSEGVSELDHITMHSVAQLLRQKVRERLQ